MIDYFLKRQQTKLEILSHLSNEKRTSFSSFLSKLELPRTTLKRAINELNTDFVENKLPCILEQDERKNYYLQFSKKTSALNIYHRLKLAYIKESLHFQLLNLLLTSNSQSISNLTDHLIISPSYCYKLIKELNALLSDFKLEISSLRKDNQFELKGEEQTLRIFSFIILTEVYQTIEWPFHHISKEDLTLMIQSQKSDHTNLSSPSKLNQVFFYLAITDLRVKNRRKLKPMSTELISIMEILTDNNDLMASKKFFSENYPLNDDVLANEVLYFNAVFRIVIAHTITPIHKQIAGKKIVAAHLNFSKNIIVFTDELLTNFNISKENSILYESIYLLSIYKIFINLINIDIETLLRISYNYPIPFGDYHYIQPNKVAAFCDTFLKENPNFSSPLFAKNNYYYTCIILDIIIRIYTKNTLKIYVQFSKVFLGERLLKQKIENLYNPSTLQFTTNFDQANLIISDSMDTIIEEENKRYFYFYDVNDRRIWLELFQFIQLNLLENVNSDYKSIWKEYFV
ncbi:helix-turn-helix domain-containing protein [Listeria monocytogenes]